MPRDLILHIGKPKTGSTSIQHLLAVNRPALLAQGMYYPATPTGNMHVLLAASFSSVAAVYRDTANLMWQGHKPEIAIARHLAELQEEVAGLPGSVSRIILSSEQFSMYLRTEEAVGRLRDFVMKFADRCTVVVYLRRQDEHFASLYSQSLRLGYIDEPNLDDAPKEYDNALFLARWAKIFGKDNVIPRVFERPAGRRFDVVEDFAGICGFDMAPMKLGGEVNKNQSMTQAGQDTLRRLGRRLSGDAADKTPVGLIWQRITDAVSTASPGKGWAPTQAAARAFVDRYAASNEAVRAAYFPEKTSLFEMSFANLPEREEAIPLETVQRATMDAFLESLEQGVAREVRLHLDKAALAQRLGDAPLQQAALNQAIRLDGTSVSARMRLAKFLISQGDTEGARQQLDVLTGLAPAAPQVAALKRRIAAVKKV